MYGDNIVQLKAQLKRIIDEGLELGDRADRENRSLTAAESLRLKEVEGQAEGLYRRVRDAEREQAIRSLGRGDFTWSPEIGGGAGLADALLQAGFGLKSQPSATVPIDHVLRLKTGSLDGGSNIEDAVPYRYVAPPLGLDARYLFPRIPTQAVAPDTTGVSTYRQRSRTLASPSGDTGTDGMIRDIDETSPKPETSTVAEVAALPLKQIATISSGTPNILLQNQNFRSWVDRDLVAAFRAALDYHITTEIQGAGIGSGPGGGASTFENILLAQEEVRSQGYNPDITVVSPGDALAVQLTMLTGGDSYVFQQVLPTFVVTTAVSDGAGFVADASALGTLSLSPFSLQVFEEEAGSTNSSTVRAEANGLMVVQRPDAAATISAAS
jgi:hypothetical protein